MIVPVILAIGLSTPPPIRMLAGLMSRWITALLCKCTNPQTLVSELGFELGLGSACWLAS